MPIHNSSICDAIGHRSGNAYIAGQTGSSDFPALAGFFQTTHEPSMTGRSGRTSSNGLAHHDPQQEHLVIL
jgi:hypothetical protein